jgi:hypothetical protein
MRTVILLFVAVSGISSCYGEQNPLSVCDIMRPKGLLEQSIQIAARILFTMHGAFLTTDSCSDHSYDIVILYPGIEGTPPVSFKLDPDATKQLSPFYRPAGGTATACGVLVGQVFQKSDFRSKRQGAGPQGNGFGPRGAFRVAFVLRSVSEIRACK